MKTLAPRWLIGLWLVVLAGVVLLSVYNPAGDPGSSNIFRLLLTGIVVLVTLLWFVIASSAPRKIRAGTLGVVLVAGAAFFALFRVDNLSGSLLPVIEPRWADRAATEVPAGARSGRADLVTTSPADFPGFLGARRDLIVRGVELETDLESHLPEKLWSQPIGKGWSGFAVVNGYAATLEQRDQAELVTLYVAETGELVWSYTLRSGSPFESVVAGDGPRSTPTIDEGIVYAMGVRGRLVALDGASGEPIWQRDLLADQGISQAQEAALLPYGRPGSPLVVENRLIVPVGGAAPRQVSVAAYDKKTGEPIWQGGEHQISMASPTYGSLAGVDQVLLVNQDWASGHDLETGAQLWEVEWPGNSGGNANVSNAVPVPPDRFLLSKGYGEGAALYRLTRRASGFEVTQLWHEQRSLRTKFTNVAIRDGHIYGLSEGVLECVELESGARAWKGGRYGHGQILLVGDVLMVLTEDGEMVYVEATPERRDNVLGRFPVLEGQTWNTPALAGDLLLVRNAREAAAYRVPIRQN